jgi:hypothetical protein
MTKDEFSQRVAELLLRQGYRFTDDGSVEAIVSYWPNQEEFVAEFTDAEIVHMYEVISMYEFLQAERAG